MFDRTSRYVNQPVITVTLPDGRQGSAVTIPLPRSELSAGNHRQCSGDRLDLLAARYLNEPTAFWRLCDLNGTRIAAALEVRPLVAIPRGGRR